MANIFHSYLQALSTQQENMDSLITDTHSALVDTRIKESRKMPCEKNGLEENTNIEIESLVENRGRGGDESGPQSLDRGNEDTSHEVGGPICKILGEKHSVVQSDRSSASPTLLSHPTSESNIPLSHLTYESNTPLSHATSESPIPLSTMIKDEISSTLAQLDEEQRKWEEDLAKEQREREVGTLHHDIYYPVGLVSYTNGRGI